MNTRIFALLVFLLSVTMFSCVNRKVPKPNLVQPKSYQNMTGFDPYWKEIDSLMENRLPKSALKKLNEIEAEVRESQHPGQLLKWVQVKVSILQQIEENSDWKNYQRFKKEIAKANTPAKEVLTFQLANFIQNWSQRNRWRIRQRTAVSENKAEDLRTWSLAKLEKETSNLYQASLNPALKEYTVSAIDPIVIKGKGTEGLRPSLFDLLAHSVLEFFTSEHNFLTEPAYQFYMDEVDYFAEAATFAQLKISTKDTESRKFAALKIFQNLTKVHIDNANIDGLVDLELLRLTFVYQNYVGDSKGELYLESLNRLRKKYPQSPITAETLLRLANYYKLKGEGYDPRNPMTKDANKKAVTFLKDAIRLYPKTFGAERCQNLLDEIEEKIIEVKVEEVYLPNTVGLVKIEYKNIQAVEVTIFKIKEPYDLFSLRGKNKWEDKINREPKVVEKNIHLKVMEDYNRHSTEFEIPPLPLGQYYLKVEEKESEMNTYMPFQVSNLAILKLSDELPGNTFQVLDRTKGLPVENAQIKLSKVKSYTAPRYRNPKKYNTDVKGQIQTKISDGYNYSIVVEKGADLLLIDRNIYLEGYYHSRTKKTVQTRFFMDRAIYRPGQTIYFKGLVYENDLDRIPHIQKRKKVIVTLHNANGQKVKDISLTTNEYGTVNGKFKLPSSGMNGQFSIRSLEQGTVQGAEYFRVEEYKRPRFEVEMNAPTKAYSIGEKVQLKGMAKNYSTAPLDGAAVKYVITRQTHFPYGRRHWGHWYNPPAPTQIAVGESVTKPDGSFEVAFEALPDRSVDKNNKPSFNYNINVTVTDVTGEVHEVQSYVQVGYIALAVDVPLAEKMNAADLRSIHISTTNLNGTFEPAKGKVKVSKLKVPSQFFIERYWNKPEYQLLSKQEFTKSFPFFAYGDEDEKENWAATSVVLNVPFDTKLADSISIGELTAGYYKVEVTTQDKHGEQIAITKFIQLEGSNSQYNTPNLFNVSEVKVTGEPGESAKIKIASAGPMNFNITTRRYKVPTINNSYSVNGAQKNISFEISERDRGGFSAEIYAVCLNRFYNQNVSFFVPWSNKDLKISFESFREKLYPGQEEKWRIKIAGPKADAAAAEVVASLYDASLDAFVPNNWINSFYPSRYTRASWDKIGSFGINSDNDRHKNYDKNFFEKQYDRINRFRAERYSVVTIGAAQGVSLKRAAPIVMEVSEMEEDTDMAVGKLSPKAESSMGPPAGVEQKTKSNAPPAPRTNLNETVFFKPDLRTDAEGNVIIEFTMNEALTRWKLMLFAHDQELRYVYEQKEVVTQKELMVIPNPPRFLREFDEIEFSAKVVNMSDKDLQPNVELQLLDELHTMPVYKWLDNPQFNKVINVPKGRSTAVSFRFKVPSVGETPLIKWTLTAVAGDYSDGEASYLPVVTNRMLVTETMPLPVKAKQSKTFTFAAMKKVSESQTLENHSLTLEFTANPAWYAVQALPYIMEYPHQCSEQIFSRLYANTLATSIANSHPKIKSVFEQWRTVDKQALVSNLSKNQELKSALLEETPWVMNALSEEEQKKNIGLLFDLDRMAGEQEKAIRTLAERQSRNGGFPWFPGGRESWYITQYMVEGFGHLDKLGSMNKKEHPRAFQIAQKAIGYIDNELLDHYRKLEKQVKKGHTKWSDDHLDNMVIHYLYARSFFLENKIPTNLRKPYDYYIGQAKKFWLNKGLYQEGLIALALQRNKEQTIARNIMKSIQERSITNDELGMYWKQSYGYYWYQLPVETNTLMIEAFQEIMKDEESVYQLKIWLLKNKQTTHWKTTKATASAVYALLMTGDNWLLEDRPIAIKIGNTKVNPEHTQAGTGYFKQTWDKEIFPKNASQISVENPNNSIAWGAVYWQYFEDLDKIKIFKDTPLQLKKELFRESQSDRGVVLNKIKEGDAIQVGDKLKMRIELRVDRAMEYVHMKDMRAAGFEPTNVLSQYKWQDGLGYYESTRDLATDFFFSYLRPGVYVFEYPMTAQLKGNFSNGVTTIQCMYAPEFSSHSEGVRVVVK